MEEALTMKVALTTEVALMMEEVLTEGTLEGTFRANDTHYKYSGINKNQQYIS